MSAEEGAADGESFGETSSFDEILAMICSDAPTVAESLKRRGFSAEMLNSFALQVQKDEGTEFTLQNLKKHVEAMLKDGDVQEVMAVFQPIKVEITGREFTEESLVEVPHCESDPTRGSHTVRIENTVFIDRSDFRTEDSEDYFGLAPGKIVALKYAFRVLCESFESNAAGEVVSLRCVALPDSELPEDKPKGSIQWMPASTAVPLEARVYCPAPVASTQADASWEKDLAAETEHAIEGALAEPYISTLCADAAPYVLFAGAGYFISAGVSATGKQVVTQTLRTGSRGLVAPEDDSSIRQRVAKARQQAEADKRAKLSEYLGSPSEVAASRASAKLSMAERAELARQKAEQETQQKIAQLKQAKKDEMANATPAGFNMTRVGSARLAEEQATQEKLERLRQEKMADFVGRRGSVMGLGENDGEESYLSPKQRQEEMRKRVEQEKQERLANFLTTKPSDADEDAPSSVSVKERYERAKLHQQQQEEERLESFRSSTTKSRRVTSVAIKDVWSEALQESRSGKSNDSANVTPSEASGAGLSRAKSKWAEALNEQKQTATQRYQQTKIQTISQFRVTDGTGLVKKRIGEWEELFMELAASVEEIEKTLAAAKLVSESSTWGHDLGELHRLQKEFRDSADVPEVFEMGSTKIFNIKLLDHHVASYIKRSLQDVKARHFALSCGVYGDEGGKPPIELFAAAIKSDEKTLYIALTIKPLPGAELDARGYGIKKVAIFSKDVNQKMLERVFDIVPQKGWERWVSQGSYGLDDPNLPPPVYPSHEESRGEGAEESELDAAAASTTTRSVNQGDEVGEGAEGEEGTGPMSPDADETGDATAAPAEEEADSSESESEESPVEERQDAAEQGEADGDADPAEEAFADVGDQEGDAAADSSSDSESEEDPDSVFADVETDAQAASAVMDDIMDAGAAESAARYVEESEEDPDEALARADFEAFAEVPSAHRESQLLSAAGNGVGGADGSNPFLGRTSSADEEDDVGETWKTTTTPSHAAHSRDEEIQRNRSIDYKFNNAGHDESLRFIKGEPLPDADGDEEVEYDADEDVNATTFNSYKPSTVARVCLPRAFLPEHVSAEMLKNPNTKYSWSIEDEREDGLPSANQCSVSINLQDIQNHHCSRNMLILEGSEQCMVFTGTLKVGTSGSKYILNGNKIFEWIRGAACSGWLLKWPMQSQKFGRRMRRFFVLRDHILSYHVTRPADEEEVYSNYSLSSLHITDNTTVEVGRHMFLRSLIVTTPLDKLWIRMQNGNEEETKWIGAINKSIQQLQRKKLFMSKVRIESKWYHESPNFNLVAVDALSYADQYIKIALFELHTPAGEVSPQQNAGGAAPPTRQYSVDIGTNIADGSALGIDGAPSTHSAKLVRTNESADLRAELRCIKIYGDVILIGGSNGFLGVGAMGFTSSVDAAGDHMQVMFCVPCGTTQVDPTVGSPQSGNSPITMRSPSKEGAMSPAGGGLHRAASFMGSGEGFPHKKTATVVSIAAAQEAHRFVAADDEGTISLWYYYKHNAISDNIEGLKTPRKGSRTPRPTTAPAGGPKAQRRGSEKLMVRKPMLKGVLNLSSIDLSGNYANERVVEMNFLLDESQLIVSTNKRLILLLLGKPSDETGPASTPKAPARRASMMSSPLTPFASTNPDNGSQTPAPDTGDANLAFLGWVELDRAIPGKVGLFAMHMSQTYVPLYTGASTASLQRTITQWRITEEDQAVASRFQLTTKKKAADGKHRCTVYRFEWTESMFSAALDQVKLF